MSEIFIDIRDPETIKGYFDQDAQALDWIDQKLREGKSLLLTVGIDPDMHYAEYALGTFGINPSQSMVGPGFDNRNYEPDDYEGAFTAILNLWLWDELRDVLWYHNGYVYGTRWEDLINLIERVFGERVYMERTNNGYALGVKDEYGKVWYGGGSHSMYIDIDPDTGRLMWYAKPFEKDILQLAAEERGGWG